MSKTEITLWRAKETSLAIFFSKVPPERTPSKEDMVWIPKSIIEHMTKFPEKNGYQMINVTLPDWFIEKNGM